jgi:Heterokaryon incompatibility protein (HET)
MASPPEENPGLSKPLFKEVFSQFSTVVAAIVKFISETGKNLGSLVLQDVAAALPVIQAGPGQKGSVPEQLCDICRKIDILRMLEERSPGLILPRLVLGRYDEIVAKHYCAFCRLTTAAINNTLVTPITPGYRDAEGKALYCLLREGESLYHEPWRRCIKVELRSGKTEKIFARSRMMLNAWMENDIRRDNDWVKGVRQTCDAQIILHLDSALQLDPRTSKSTNLYPMLGCTPLPSFRLDKVQEWHQACGGCAGLPFTERHGEINTAPPGIRVIDVMAMKIVSAPETCVYAALSYVWGQIAYPIRATKANREVMETNNGLRKFNIPRTIQEALTVVKSLGFRYFWVDSLCIIQDDLEYQMQQINAMDQIYQSAALTIIAAGGNSADDSLFPKLRGQIVHVEEIRGLKLMARNKPFDQAVVGSTWNIRAWCYQEKMLSRKILLFTNTEVYYDCSHYTWCESMHWGDYNGRAARPEPKVEKIGDSFWELWHPMREILHQYTLRSLTNEADIVSAIYGTLKSLSAGLVDMVGGVPIRLLMYSMLWQPAASNRRRSWCHAPYPSWSWIGWVGPARFPFLNCSPSYERFSGPVDTPTRSSIVTAWYFRNSNNSPIHLKDVLLLPHHKPSPPSPLHMIGRREVESKTKELTDLELNQLYYTNIVLVRTTSGAYEYASVSELGDPSKCLFGTSEEILATESVQESGVLQSGQSVPF